MFMYILGVISFLINFLWHFINCCKKLLCNLSEWWESHSHGQPSLELAEIFNWRAPMNRPVKGCLMTETTLRSELVRERHATSLCDRLSRRFCRLEATELMAAARRQTGLEDFGEPPLEPALSLLSNSLEQQADLHPLGRFLMRMHLSGLLSARLRLMDYWRGRPAAEASKRLERPVFITGMPRSGSTFLHELLAQDPENRAPRVWEVMFPVPLQQRPRQPDPRISKAAVCLWWFRRLAPQADAVFPMRANTPHECVAIQSHTFLSEEFISTCRIPAYESFLRQADLRPAYAWERRFLQHLQSDSPSRRWVLKSPDHVYGLEALFSTFPDALIIQTHRNPLDVLKSSCHLTEVLHGLYARPRSGGALAARESQVLAASLERFISFRDAHPELAGRFIDLTYEEITAQPLDCIRRIYEQFGFPLRDAAEKRMQQLTRERSRYRNGRAPAAPSEMCPATLAQTSAFERYCSRFKLDWRQARTQ
jgi:hypothetical protein